VIPAAVSRGTAAGSFVGRGRGYRCVGAARRLAGAQAREPHRQALAIRGRQRELMRLDRPDGPRVEMGAHQPFGRVACGQQQGVSDFVCEHPAQCPSEGDIQRQCVAGVGNPLAGCRHQLPGPRRRHQDPPRVSQEQRDAKGLAVFRIVPPHRPIVEQHRERQRGRRQILAAPSPADVNPFGSPDAPALLGHGIPGDAAHCVDDRGIEHDAHRGPPGRLCMDGLTGGQRREREGEGNASEQRRCHRSGFRLMKA
jgi:hypothetical protein